MSKIVQLVIWWRMNCDSLEFVAMLGLILVLLGGMAGLAIFQPDPDAHPVPYAIVMLSWFVGAILAFRPTQYE